MSPANGTVLREADTKKPITLRWTPVVPPPPVNDVMYTIRIYEVNSGQQPAQAMKGNTVFEKQVPITQTIWQLPSEYIDSKESKTFVWNVEASDKEGNIYGIKSDYFTFTSEGNRSPSPIPAICPCNIPGIINYEYHASGSFDPSPGAFQQLSTTCGSVIHVIQGSRILIKDIYADFNLDDLTLGTQVLTDVDAGSVEEYAFDSCHNYKLAFICISTGGAITQCPCDLFINVDCPPPSCTCGQWNNISLSSIDVTGMPLRMTKNCGDTFNIASDANFVINPFYTCQGTVCNTTYKYDVFTPTGNQLYYNVDGSMILPSEINDCSGYYKIIIKPTCGFQSCSPCTIYLKRGCPPCTCLSSNLLSYFKTGTAAEIKVKCWDTLIVSPTDEFTYFSKLFNCANHTTCASSGSASLYGPNGTVLFASATMSSIAWTTAFHFTECNGIYKLVFRGNCGTTQCDSCVYFVKVNCPCICSANDSANYVLNGVLHQSKCNDTIQVFSTYSFTSFTKTFNCSYPSVCMNTTAATLYSPNNTVIEVAGVNGFNWNPGKKFTACDSVYKIVFEGNCGNSVCNKCTTYIKVNCPPLPCACGSWDTIKIKDGSASGISRICGETLVVKQNVSYNFTARLSCMPLSNSCTLNTSTYTVYKGNQVMAQGVLNNNNIAYAFPDCSNNYKIVFKGKCGTNVCDSCILYIHVDCCGAGDLKLFKETMYGSYLPVSTQNCVPPGNLYSINIVGAAPPPGIINYQMITTPDNFPVSSGSFTYNPSGKSITIPPYICGYKTGFRIICNWNNNNCKDTLVGTICPPPCCVNFKSKSDSLTGPPANRIAIFNTVFTTLPLVYTKIKVQLLDITTNAPWPLTQAGRGNANIFELTAAPNSSGTTTGTISAITLGTAIWFTNFTSSSNITFNGKIFLGPELPTPTSAKFKIRYTFYRNNGSCREVVCEKDVQY